LNVEIEFISGNLMVGTMPDLITAIRKLDGEVREIDLYPSPGYYILLFI
jgi:hypothetical protein